MSPDQKWNEFSVRAFCASNLIYSDIDFSLLFKKDIYIPY